MNNLLPPSVLDDCMISIITAKSQGRAWTGPKAVMSPSIESQMGKIDEGHQAKVHFLFPIFKTSFPFPLVFFLFLFYEPIKFRIDKI